MVTQENLAEYGNLCQQIVAIRTTLGKLEVRKAELEEIILAPIPPPESPPAPKVVDSVHAEKIIQAELQPPDEALELLLKGVPPEPPRKDVYALRKTKEYVLAAWKEGRMVVYAEELVKQFRITIGASRNRLQTMSTFRFGLGVYRQHPCRLERSELPVLVSKENDNHAG